MNRQTEGTLWTLRKGAFLQIKPFDVSRKAIPEGSKPLEDYRDLEVEEEVAPIYKCPVDGSTKLTLAILKQAK